MWILWPVQCPSSVTPVQWCRLFIYALTSYNAPVSLKYKTYCAAKHCWVTLDFIVIKVPSQVSSNRYYIYNLYDICCIMCMKLYAKDVESYIWCCHLRKGLWIRTLPQYRQLLQRISVGGRNICYILNSVDQCFNFLIKLLWGKSERKTDAVDVDACWGLCVRGGNQSFVQ